MAETDARGNIVWKKNQNVSLIRDEDQVENQS